MKTQTQKERILKLLEKHPAGINSFGVARDLALQLPTRIFELREAGYSILSLPKKDGSVDYILETKPRVSEVRAQRPTYQFVGNTAYLVTE